MNNNQSTINVAFDGNNSLGKLIIEGQPNVKQCRIEDMINTIEMSVQKGTGFLSRQSNQNYQFASNNRIMKITFENPQNYVDYINVLDGLIDIEQRKNNNAPSENKQINSNNNTQLANSNIQYILTETPNNILRRTNGVDTVTNVTELVNLLTHSYSNESVQLISNDSNITYKFNLDQYHIDVIWTPEVAKSNRSLIPQIINKYMDIQNKSKNNKPNYVDYNCVDRILKRKNISFVTLSNVHIGYLIPNNRYQKIQ